MSKNAIKSIVLLSGGLDSVVSLAVAKEKLNPTLALTFDYGQKSLKKEVEASSWFCKYYGLEHRIIKLEWLKDITMTSLVSEDAVPSGLDTMKSVWVPNRNGLFLNIAGCFADAQNFSHIIIGANREEAGTFPDNTKSFIEKINAEFEYSTTVHPKVIAPLIDFDKVEIVHLALEKGVPLGCVYSCYKNGKIHCGVCESCMRFKRALKANNASGMIKFEE